MFDVRKIHVSTELTLPLKLDKGTTDLKGVVVWIHPQKRFFRVRFDLHGKAVHESYNFYGPLKSEKEGNLK